MFKLKIIDSQETKSFKFKNQNELKDSVKNEILKSEKWVFKNTSVIDLDDFFNSTISEKDEIVLTNPILGG